MSKIIYGNAEDYPVWMQIEDLGYRLNQLRGAMQVGMWALMENENCVGTIAEEMSDYVQVMRYFCEGMEGECNRMCKTLLQEQREQKEAV